MIDGEPFDNCYSEADTSDPLKQQAAAEAVRHFEGPVNRFRRHMVSTNPKYRTRVRLSWLLPCVKTAISMTNLETLQKGVGAGKLRIHPPPPPAIPSHVDVRLLPAHDYPDDYLTVVRLSDCPSWRDILRPTRTRDDRDPQTDPLPQPIMP